VNYFITPRIGALDRRKVPEPSYKVPERRTSAVTLGRIRINPEESSVRRILAYTRYPVIVDERHSESLHLFKLR
jgi:hypothetical protein